MCGCVGAWVLHVVRVCCMWCVGAWGGVVHVVRWQVMRNNLLGATFVRQDTGERVGPSYFVVFQV